MNPPFGMEDGAKYWIRHHHDFIEAIRSDREPMVPVETGHRTCTVCTLGNIAHELKEILVWDPESQTFPASAEASEQLHYQCRDGFRKI